MVTWENYEEIMLLYVDGELSEADEKALMVFVDTHPELREELAVYESTRMIPDTTIMYSRKEQLLKQVPAGRVISINTCLKYGSIAAILLVGLFFINRWINPGTNAVNTVRFQSPIASKPAIQTNMPASQKSELAPGIKHETLAVNKAAVTPAIARKSVHSNNLAKVPDEQIKTIDPIQQLNTSVALKAAAPVKIEATRASIPRYEETAAAQEHPQEFLAWLPVNEEKREGFEGLKNNLTDRITKAKNIKENLKNTDLVLRFGNRDIHVLNF